MERLQDYVRRSAAQVRALLQRNDLPTDLQLHRYTSELVRSLAALTAGAPEGVRREVARPFEGFWDFGRNAALPGAPLRVVHLSYVLRELEALLLACKEVANEVAVRDVNHEIRRLLARTRFDRISQDLLQPGGVLVRGVRVKFEFKLAPDGSHHTFAWSFCHGSRDVQDSVLYWDEQFDYGGCSGRSDSGSGGEMSDSGEEAVDDATHADTMPHSGS